MKKRNNPVSEPAANYSRRSFL